MRAAFGLIFILAILLLLAGWFSSMANKLTKAPELKIEAINKEKGLANPSQRYLKIGQAVFEIELADDQARRALGLSGRKFLPEGNGLFFIFEKPDLYPFWMKEMDFPIDIIWIDENKKIIDLTEDARPDSYPQTFVSKNPALYVLDVNAGTIKKYEIKIGEEIFLSE